jgi:spore germination protein GerM
VLGEEKELIVTVASGSNELSEKAAAIIEELKKSGRSGIPLNSKVLSAAMNNDTLTINFSKEFEKEHSGGSTGISITMASLVLSLTELKGVNAVSFLIDGKTVSEFLGHIEFNKPFKRAEYEYMIVK